MRWLLVRVMAIAIPLRFDSRAADGINARIVLRLGLRGRVAALTLVVSDRVCRVRPGATPDPDATARITLADLVRLVLGQAGWPQLLSRGRFELSGDPFLAMRLPALFRLPAARRTQRTGALKLQN